MSDHDAVEQVITMAWRAHAGHGCLYRVAGTANWIMKWRSLDGTIQVKSSGTARKGEAENTLDEILDQQRGGENVTKSKLDLTFCDAADALINAKTLKGLKPKSLSGMERRLRLHLIPFFGKNRLLVTVDSDLVSAFAVKRQKDTIIVRRERTIRTRQGVRHLPEIRRPVSNAEINRELDVLSGMFSNAEKSRGFRHRPAFPKLPESEPRSGFFSREMVDEVSAKLPDVLASVLRFYFITGWRAVEVLQLTWDRVDFDGRGVVWLDGSMTKNKKPRKFFMTGELRKLLEQRLAATEKLKQRDRIVPWVFHRERFVRQPDKSWKKEPGQPIRSFTKAFKTACISAGYPGRLIHDFRRSAIREWSRKGIGESLGMRLSGHLTPSVYRRYDIIVDSDLEDAAARLDAAALPAKSEKKTARVRPFKRRG